MRRERDGNYATRAFYFGLDTGKNSRISVQASGDMYALYTRTCNLDYLDMPEPQWSAFQKSRTLSWTDPDIGGASSLFATCLFFSLLIASFLVLGQTRGREKCLWPDESSRVSHCITHLIDERSRKSNPWYAKGRQAKYYYYRY